MPRVSLEHKRYMGPHGLLAVAIVVAIVVAFGYWCHEVKRAEDAGAIGTNGTAAATGTPTDSVNANRRRDEAFQGAVAGFLLLFALKHLRQDF